MGKDLIVGEVDVEKNGPIYDIIVPRPGSTAFFQVFEDLDAVRWSGEPEADFRRLSNGMYIYNYGSDEKFWEAVHAALNIHNRRPTMFTNTTNRQRYVEEQRILKQRGGGTRVVDDATPHGQMYGRMYYHDDMLKDLDAMIVPAIKKAGGSARRSCRCPAPKKPAKRAAKR